MLGPETEGMVRDILKVMTVRTLEFYKAEKIPSKSVIRALAHCILALPLETDGVPRDKLDPLYDGWFAEIEKQTKILVAELEANEAKEATRSKGAWES